jgi:uncharacterized protein (DUF58 family)
MPLARAESLAASLPPLLVAAERVAATVSQGVHGRRRVGEGETFWQFRRYQPGDATARIDWRQSGKSHHVFIRQTEWEAAQSVWLWRDGSPSMEYASRRAFPAKREHADLLLLALASLLSRGGEHIAMLGTGIAPATGRAVLERLAATLSGPMRRSSSLPAAEPLPRYGRVVLFGDWLAPLEELSLLLSRFARAGVRGHLVHIFDPAEASLPFAGRVRFDGPEGEGDIVFGRVESVRAAYAEAFAHHRRGVAALAASAGFGLLTHTTDKPLQPTLLALWLAVAGERDGRGPKPC